MTRLRTLAAVGVCALLATASRAGADAVTHWNDIATRAVIVGRPGPPGFLDMALVQVAVYDAVQSVERQFKPYYVEVPGASGSSSVAAARAAHDLLVWLYAANPVLVASLNADYESYLSANGLSAADPGAAVGATVAISYQTLYRPAGEPATSPGGTGPGVWRPTPPANLAGLAPWLGHVTPFTLDSPSQFRAHEPPALTSPRYRRDYDEVKTIGAANSTYRTADQTALALFYTDNYIAMLNRTVRQIADAHLDHIADTARLLALTNLATADAVITVWDSKYHYNLWRPITAIRQGDIDGNPETIGDTGWLSFATTPNYPDYTSGASAVTAATMRILRRFFKSDHFTFSMTSLVVNQARRYSRLSDVESDVVDARVYEGIHFRFANEAGRKQGQNVAKWVFRHYLRPVHENPGAGTDADGEDADSDH